MSRLIRRMFDRANQKMPKRGRVARPVRTVADLKTRLLVHPLEERVVPNSYIVNALTDTGAGSGTTGDLRYCINQANANTSDSDDISFNVGGPGVDFSRPQIINLTTVLAINGPTLITGQGADKTIIRQTGAAGVITIGTSANPVTIDSVTLTGARGSSGGGVFVSGATPFTIKNSAVTGNSVSGTGGGIYMNNGGSLQVDSCTLSNNTAASGGGAITFYGTVSGTNPFFNIFNSTLANNTVTSTTSAGSAIQMKGTFSGALLILNSTITGNSTASTSTTAGYGGAIARSSGTGASTVTISSSIVSGNLTTATNNKPDISANSGLTITTDHTLIGSTNGFTYTAGSGDLTPGTAVTLAPLGYYGGPVQVLYPLLNGGTNPLVNAGDDGNLGASTDERGVNFDATNYPRTDSVSGLTDIGSAERNAAIGGGDVVSPSPSTTANNFGNVTTTGTSYQFKVTYSSESAINTGAGTNDVTVFAPAGVTLGAVTRVGTDATIPNAVVVTYQVAAPAGGWTANHNGTYFVRTNGGGVTNMAGGSLPASAVSTFKVVLPKTFIVANTLDSGAGSLRQAIIDANTLAGTADTIDLSGVTGVISLLTALPTISDSLTITGPALVSGQPQLIVSRGTGTFQMFNITDGSASTSITVNLNNFVITGGNSGVGAGIADANETVTLTNMLVTGNSTSSAGGGIAVTAAGGSLTLINTVVSNNSAAGVGGGISMGTAGTSLSVRESAIVLNKSSSASGGAGVYFSGTIPVSGQFTISNSTVANNTATSTSTTGGAGGIEFRTLNTTNAPVNIRNSTISGNSTASTSTTAGQGGGGIGVAAVTAGAVINITSTVVSGNLQTGGTAPPDVSTPATGVTVNTSFSAIGSATGFNGRVSTNDLADGSNLKLGPLQFNGGSVPSMYPLATSPLIDFGNNPATALPTDTRGTGFLRTVDDGPSANGPGDQTDIGAVERVGNSVGANGLPNPTAVYTTVNSAYVTANGNTYSVKVLYTPETANGATIDTTTGGTGVIGASDITVTVPAGVSPVTILAVPSADIDTTTVPGSVIVTYRFNAPGGTWGGEDNGLYAVRMAAGQVTDNTGAAAAAQVLGTFTVGLPATYTVTNTLDDGSVGSLRWAITNSNATPGLTDTIAFSNTSAGGATNFFDTTPDTIVLATALPSITDPVMITGGALDATFHRPLLTVQRSSSAAAFSVFTVSMGAASTFTLSNMAITGGSNSGSGGGIVDSTAAMTLTNVEIIGNTASTSGGGIYISGSSAGLITIRNSTIANNTAVSSYGGGMDWFNSGAQLLMENSTMSGNRAGSTSFNGGGAMYIFSTLGAAGFNIRNSTISGNSTGYNGGGIFWTGSSGTFNIQNSTITNNTASNTGTGTGAGGGGLSNTSTAAITVTSSIVSGNFLGATPNDISAGGTVTADHSAFGVSTGLTAASVTAYNTSANANLMFGTLLQLGPLQYNAGPGGSQGPTQTHLPSTSSPLLDKGVIPSGVTEMTDQRGQGTDTANFPRLSSNGMADIGSVEAGNATIPSAAATPGTVTPNATTYTFTVTYTDPTPPGPMAGMDTSTIIGNNTVVHVTGGPASVDIAATYVAGSIDNPANGSPRTATYSIVPPGGSWDNLDNGTYQIVINDATVHPITNVNGTPVPVGQIGSFMVGVAGTYVVTNTLDDTNPGSLRWAIGQADATVGVADVIRFNGDPTLGPPVAGTNFWDATPDVISLQTLLPNVSDSVDVFGPGSGLLTVQRDPAAATTFRVFHITNTNTVTNITVTMSGMTVTGGGGSGFTGTGAGIDTDDELVTLTDLVITGNTTTGLGGGIEVNTNGTLTLRNSTVSNNSTSSNGGGINFASGGFLLMENSTVSGNTGGSTTGGGGIGFTGTVAAGGFTIRNSTIANNVSPTGGGIGLRGTVTGNITIQNSTITGNQATSTSTTTGYAGGGISKTGTGGTVTLTSTILSGNVTSSTDTTRADLSANGTGTVTATYSAIGVAPAASALNSASANNLPYGANLNLGSLGPNGGPTQTILLGSGSAAIDRGIIPLGVSEPTDQRGAGTDTVNYPRTRGIHPDIGAVEVVSAGIPIATVGALTNITSSAAPVTYQFTVTYEDDGTISLATTNGANDPLAVTVSGTNAPGPISIVNVTVNSPGNVSVTYQFTAPGGTWDQTDNGTYTIATTSDPAHQVQDTLGNPVAAGNLGTFTVAIPVVYVVTNTLDDLNPGSLRWAIGQSNGTVGLTDAILFNGDPTLGPPVAGTNFYDATPDTITLSGTELLITDSVAIIGPGSGLLTVTGNSASRIFETNNTTAALTVSISGMRLTGGNGSTGSTAAAGGAITNNDEALTLTDLLIEGNSASEGGAVNVTAAAGSLTVLNSTLRNNRATSDDGGAVNMQSSGSLTIRNSTISGNSAVDDGGALYFFSSGTLLIENSTLSGNNAGTGTTAGGGAMYLYATTNATISNSTIFGNTAGSGGAITLNSYSGTLTLRNSTMTGNVALTSGAGYGGGGIVNRNNSGTVTITSSIISGNTGSDAPDLKTTAAFAIDHSAVGSGTGFDTTVYNTAANGNLALGANLMLGQLMDNGGPTFTIALGTGSPAIDHGAIPTGVMLPFDQRGLNRTVDVASVPNGTGGATDIGAFEVDPTVPTAALSGTLTSPINSGNANAMGVNPYTFTVTYAANSGTIIQGTISANNIIVTVPAGAGAVTVNPVMPADINATDPANVIVTYHLTPPGGTWNSADNGTYSIATTAVGGNQVQNTGMVHVAATAIGSFAVAFPAPVATLNGTLVTPINAANAAANNPYVVTVTYAANIGTINLGSISPSNLTVNGPFAVGVAVGNVNSSNPASVVVTYNITPPGGTWDQPDNGNYQIATTGVAANQVQNSDGGRVLTTAFGTLQVAVGAVYVVTNTLDDTNPGSLRWAVGQANSNVNVPDSILFNGDPILGPPVAGTNFYDATPDLITLGGTELLINDSVTITGPGSALLTVSGNGSSRIFETNNTTAALTVSISGMHLTGGNGSTGSTAAAGGAITNNDEALTLTDLLIEGNSATEGGAVNVSSAAGSLTVLNSTFRNNQATSDDGGAVNMGSSGTLTIRNSTISGNSAADDGGALYFFSGGTLVLDSSTVSGNNAGSGTGNGGGAMYLYGAVTATISNSTLFGNMAGSGGAITLNTFSGTLTLRNSTITGNVALTSGAGYGGGGIVNRNNSGTVTIASSIISGNTGPDAPDLKSTSAFTIDHSAVGDGTGWDSTNYVMAANANLALGTVLNLLPLGNYGGPTQTVAFGRVGGVDSPLLNAGSNPAGLMTDQRAAPRSTPATPTPLTDIGAYEYQPITAAVTVNNSTDPQRSSVRSYTITFSGPVDFAGGNTVAGALAAISLARVNSAVQPGGPLGNVPINAATSSVVLNAQGHVVSVTLKWNNATFTELANTAAGADPSLIDGLYRLTINAAMVTDAVTAFQLDGDQNGTVGGNKLFDTHRLFGDIDGDSDTDADDLFGSPGTPGILAALFQSPLDSHQAAFDFEGDGDVDADDLFSFFLPRLFTSI